MCDKTKLETSEGAKIRAPFTTPVSLFCGQVRASDCHLSPVFCFPSSCACWSRNRCVTAPDTNGGDVTSPQQKLKSRVKFAAVPLH